MLRALQGNEGRGMQRLKPLLHRAGRCTAFLVGVSAVTCVSGCAPGAQRTAGVALSYSIRRAAVDGDSLSVQGTISPQASFTDFGVRVREVRDDTARKLDFKCFQLFWMKDLCFEVEFEAPADTASSVEVDMDFLSRSGKERVKATIPITRNAVGDYRSQLDRWRDP